jgi:predicted amidophosphoribosyltransferase
MASSPAAYAGRGGLLASSRRRTWAGAPGPRIKVVPCIGPAGVDFDGTAKEPFIFRGREATEWRSQEECMYPCPPLVPLGTDDTYCARCSRPLAPDDVVDDGCWACYWWDLLDDVAVITYGTHRGAFRIGSDIKYAKEAHERRNGFPVAAVLYNYLGVHWPTIEATWSPTRVTFVPSHPDKVEARGFDFLKEVVDWHPTERDRFGISPILIQTDPEEQPSTQRRPSPEAWDLRNGVDVVGDRIMVIDDVITSGATLGGIAQMLRRNGAEAVFGLAITRPVKGDAETRVLTELSGRRFDWGLTTIGRAPVAR